MIATTLVTIPESIFQTLEKIVCTPFQQVDQLPVKIPMKTLRIPVRTLSTPVSTVARILKAPVKTGARALQKAFQAAEIVDIKPPKEAENPEKIVCRAETKVPTAVDT